MKSSVTLIVKPLGAICLMGVVVLLCFTAFSQWKSEATHAASEESLAPRWRTYPPYGIPVLLDDTGLWDVLSSSQAQSDLTERRDATVPSGKGMLALQVSERQPREDEATIQIQRVVTESLLRDSRLKVSFWGRSPTGGTLTVIFNPVGKVETDLYKEDRTNPDLYQEIPLTKEWKEYTFSFRLKRSYSIGGANLKLQPGRTNATYELADITAIDFGPGAGEAGTGSED